MSEYVKLSEITKVLSKLYEEPVYSHLGEDWHAGVYAVEKALTVVPVVGVAEPKFAYWKTREAQKDTLWMECSSCGYKLENFRAVILGDKPTDIKGVRCHVCPNCEARMINKEN